MLLDVREITTHYNKVTALDDISIEIEDGEIVTLIGANGAGKTTTMMCISGLKRLTSGEIWFQGERIDKKRSGDIVKMGVVQIPEGRRVFPEMSVLENLQLGAYTRKDRKEISRDLEDVYNHFPRLKERRRQMAGSLSGGEQQMLAIGRGLMSSPKLLLLDEPSLGLSPLFVEEISKIITDINKMGVTIVLVEQNARMALSLANRGYVIETGKIVLQDDAQTLLNNDEVKQAYLGI